METSLVHQGKHHGFHHIVFVVGIGHFVAVKLSDSFIKGTFTQLGTEGTGILLFSLFKDNPANLCRNYGIRNLKVLAELLYRFQIESGITQIYRNSFQFKVFWIELLQSLQCIEKSQAVLTA